MSPTHPVGLSRAVNLNILRATVMFSILALLTFVGLALAPPDHYRADRNLVFGLSLLACSACSLAYARCHGASYRWVIRHLDHSAIFLLIAGTYTPYAAAQSPQLFGHDALRIVWGCALACISLRLAIRHGYDRLFIGLYIIFGWLLAATIPSVSEHMSFLPLTLLAAGGLVYTIGAAIFARDIGPWTDAVWHGCVLFAGCLHFAGVLSLGTHTV